MLRIPGGVLTRVITIPAAVVVALTVAGAGLAPPAGAVARQADPLADAAARTLTDLRTTQTIAQAADSGGLPFDDGAAAEAAYHADLGVVADLVAPRTASPPEAFLQAWSAAGPTRMTVLMSALAEVGVPYRGNTSDPEVSFDCSGFTMYAWGQVGVALPHNDYRQMAMAEGRSWDTALPADLVQRPGHVMLYVGAGDAIVHAPNTGTVVRVQEVPGGARVASPIE